MSEMECLVLGLLFGGLGLLWLVGKLGDHAMHHGKSAPPRPRKPDEPDPYRWR